MRGMRHGLARVTRDPGLAAPILGLLLYAAWATNVTWPVLQAPGDSVLGGLGDQTGGIAYLREAVQERELPFLAGTLDDFNAPEGRRIDWEINLSGWPWMLPAWLIALAWNSIAAFALTTWLGLVLSGVTMQALATRLTRSAAAGIVAGFAFAFFPYAVIKTASHPVFAHGWPLALLAWRQLEVYDAPTRRNVVLAAGAGILAVGFTGYYVLIGGVLIAMCAVIALVAAWRRGGGGLRVQARAQAVVAGSAVVYLAILSALTLEGGSGSLRAHDPSTVVDYAARLHEFFVPFGRNVVFGDETAPWLQQRQHGSNFTETTLYLGLVVLALAVVGLVVVLLRRTPPRLRWGWVAACAITLGGVAWSAPPEVVVGPFTVPTPSKFVVEITTTWRVYARFVIVVMLGVSLMAAVGIAGIVRNRGRVTSGLVAILALGAVATDFWWRPGALRLEEPRVFDVLRDRPRGILAHYPLLPAGFGDSADIFWQDAHGHPVLNGYAENGYEDRRAGTLYYVDRPHTARRLASLGVRYVFLPDADYPLFTMTPYPGTPRAGFRLLGRGPYGASDASVYAVTARPDPGYAYVRVGGGDEEGPAHDPIVWLTGPEARIDVDAPRCAEPCRGRLELRAASLGRTRVATLTLPGGKVLWQGKIGGRPRGLSLPLEVRGSVEVAVRTRPGPRPVSQTIPNSPDPRSVSLQVSRLRFAR